MAARRLPLDWLLLALSLALLGAGAAGLWTRLGAQFPLDGASRAVAVAALGLLPLGLAALALERGRPAPALRAWPAPWLICALVYVSVQLSGALASPLGGLYVLLGLYLARHTEWYLGLGLALLVSSLEALPLGLHSAEIGPPHWPGALALLWPLAGLLSGWLTQGSLGQAPRLGARPEGPSPKLEPGGGVWPLLQAEGAAPHLDAAAVLEQDLQGSLNLAMDSHPDWNALALWWGTAEGLSLRGLRLRQGVAASLGTALPPGEGLLGLVMREQRRLNVEPLASSAAKGLPYYAEPGPARMLLALPLADEGRLIGLLACDKADEAPFGSDEAAALESLARVLVGHAQRAAYLQRLQDAGARTNKLYEAIRSLAGGSLDRDELLSRFGALLGSVVAQDSWALAWLEEEGGPLLRLASAGYASAAAPSLALQQNSALASLLQQADAAVVFNGEASAIPAALNEGLAKPAQHFLLVPLRLGGRLAGVLKLDRRLAPFEEDERENALIFGSQAAITLENARLYTLHQRLATTDGLTGLYNHRFFQERLASELVQAERTGRPLSLALTDIDFFKKFNDTFGHQEGDVVLRKVAQLLKERVRPGKDIVCRYGGEEFVVILPDCDIVEARQVMDALRAYCGAHLIGGSGPEARAITMSIGLCSYPQGAKEQRDIIHLADEALYKAKKGGRNQVCSYKDLP